MITTKRKNRLFYIPGLISLIALPIICLWHLNEKNAFQKQTLIEINWWYDWNKINTIKTFDVHPERNYQNIHITSNDELNKVKLDNSKLEIKKLISTKDTTKGVHFKFDDNSNYWTFIRAVDICKVEKANYFVAKDNDLWVFNIPPQPISKVDIIEPILCGTGSMNWNMNVPDEEELKKAQLEYRRYIIETLQKYSLSIVLFILLVLLSARMIYKKHQLFARKM